MRRFFRVGRVTVGVQEVEPVQGAQRSVQVGPCTLHLGDALDILPYLLGVAHLCVTDPPYKLTSGGNTPGAMGGKFDSDVYDNTGLLMDTVQWQQIGGPIYRALVKDADCYVMAEDKNVFAAHAGFLGAGFKYHGLLSWDKGAPSRSRFYMKHMEFTLFLWKGGARDIARGGDKRGQAMPRPKNAQHPTQKPVDLMKIYIRNSSRLGQVVLDPFVGSGTTLVAALRLGRRGIGIEKDPKYFDQAVQRICAAFHEQELMS